MSGNLFNLFMEVISAAKEGRFIYGNGAQWHIIDRFGRMTVIDTCEGTTTLVPEYTGTPRTDHSQSRRLEEFLMATQAEEGHTGEIGRNYAEEYIEDAKKNGNFIFGNGNHYFIRKGGTVVVYEMGTTIRRGMYQMVQFTAMTTHGAWKYLRANGINN
jgi:hypothetical protein